MDVTIERRDGRVTNSEYRAVVTIGARSAAGPWEYTKKHARMSVAALRRSLFDADEAERRMEAGSRDRCARIRTRLEVDRRISGV